MRDVFISKLLLEAKENKKITLITGDLGFGVLDAFAHDLPNQYFNAGVAEQNMTGVAAGMALDGKIVFTYSIGNFPTLRALEQIRNDAAYHDANVKVVCVGGGFSYGALGMSHHATEDVAIMRSLPQITVLTPGCLWEAENCARVMVETEGTCYLRLDKSNAGTTNFPDEKFTLGKMRRIRDGQDAVIFAMGGILENALQAADELLKIGIFIRVYSVSSIKPFDSEEVIKAIRECGICFTLEEHVLAGGLGGLIAETCMDSGVLPSFFYRFAIRGGYSSIVGSQDYLRERHGLSGQHIEKKIINVLRG
jgi:transketolase